MTALAEQLQTWAARQPTRPTVSPVSRIELELTDKAAFEQVVQKAVRWMQERTTSRIPIEALDGAPFEADTPGANFCRAARVDAADGAAWAGRLDFRDPNTPQREWRTEIFVRRELGALTRFGVQLTCITHGEGPGYAPSRPRFVREVIEELSAEADGWPVNHPAHVLGASEMYDFERLLADPERRLPIVAISKDEFGRSAVVPERLASVISGAAHVFVLDFDRCMELTRAVGKPLSVFKGAVRLYLPGFDEETDDRFRHPLWLMPENGAGRDIASEIARRLFGAVLAGSSPATFLSVTQLQRVAAEQAFALRAPASDLERVQQELERERRRAQQFEEDYETALALARASEADLLQVRAESERAKEENYRLKQQLAAYREADAAAGNVTTDRPLASYDDLDDWAREVLGERIVFSRKALKACAKDGSDAMLPRIEEALLAIRDYKLPLLLEGGLDKRTAWQTRCSELALEDGPCFTDRKQAKNRDEYSANANGATYVLYDHIKYGTSTDLGEAFRIYYAWDDQKKIFVIGSMPHHLDNAHTN